MGSPPLRLGTGTAHPPSPLAVSTSTEAGPSNPLLSEADRKAGHKNEGVCSSITICSPSPPDTLPCNR